MTANIKNNRRIAKNTLLLYFRMILTMLVSLYASRVVLNVLGVEDFGIYNLVGGLVTMFVFLNGAMASSTQRFFAYEIGRNDFEKLKKTFNASLFVHFFIALILGFLTETIGLWLLENHLTIPNDRMAAARVVFHFSALSFIITIIKVPYNAIIIANEKMSIYAYLSIFEVVMKLLIVFMLTWISFDKLKLYSILVLGVNLFVALLYFIYARTSFLETKFKFVTDKILYKTLISYSGWNLFGNLALVAKGQGVTIVLNIFFGPVVNAAQGIANQVNAAVISFFTNFQMAVNPQIIKSYSSNDRVYMFSLINRSAKFSFYLLFVLSLPIILEVDLILTIWLNKVPKYASTFTVLILTTIMLDSISGPLMTGIQATGKIRLFQVIVGTLQILILPLTYLFFKFDYPPPITYVISIFISLVALIIRLLLFKKLIKEFSLKLFIKEVLLTGISVAALSTCLPVILKFVLKDSILNSVIIIVVFLLSSICSIYFLGLNDNERMVIKRIIKKLLKRINSFRIKF